MEQRHSYAASPVELAVLWRQVKLLYVFRKCTRQLCSDNILTKVRHRLSRPLLCWVANIVFGQNLAILNGTFSCELLESFGIVLSLFVYCFHPSKYLCWCLYQLLYSSETSLKEMEWTMCSLSFIGSTILTTYDLCTNSLITDKLCLPEYLGVFVELILE